MKLTFPQVKLAGLIRLPRTRTSHPVSAWLRPVFEAKKLRAIVGANLAAVVVVVGVAGTPTGIGGQWPGAETPILTADTPVVVTEGRFQVPLGALGMSQGFRAFHPGVDLRAPLGTPIYPVADGKVIRIIEGSFGYGRRVIVDHGDGITSLYAHLGKIKVEEGETVTRETVLGEVGLTGWTTGPHLHLEIHQNGLAFNPLQVLPNLN